jgi:hypothetical protein
MRGRKIASGMVVLSVLLTGASGTAWASGHGHGHTKGVRHGAFAHSKRNNGTGHGHGHGGAVTMTGTTTCTVSNIRLTFATPLTATPTATTTAVTMSFNVLKGCTNSSQGGVKLNNGHLSSLTGTLATGGTCSSFLSSTNFPSLSSGSVMWTPPSKVAGSTVIGFPAGTVSTTSSGQLQLNYTGGSVSGSFATTTGSLSALSSETATALAGECSSGLSAISFDGTFTL